MKTERRNLASPEAGDDRPPRRATHTGYRLQHLYRTCQIPPLRQAAFASSLRSSQMPPDSGRNDKGGAGILQALKQAMTDRPEGPRIQAPSSSPISHTPDS